MSVQFGRWNFADQPSSTDLLVRAHNALSPYGPDGGNSYINGPLSILHLCFHTTEEAKRETQPYRAQSGTVVTWDGRLDNRQELVDALSLGPSRDSSDIRIVAAAYDRWGTDVFSKLVGDWAVSIWDPSEQSIVLARDFMGIRPLFYTVEKGRITWSSILDALILLSECTFMLNMEYVAGWLSFFPAPQLTPYIGIRSVPPSSYVRLDVKNEFVCRYWNLDPERRVRYRTDAEYEHQFRCCFTESVRRRLRSDRPVLAELSGGMDSSAIVCVADNILARGLGETPRLDTLSYYDDSEPNWNELPYVKTVEEKRGRAGCHIDLSSQKMLDFEFSSDRLPATPAASARPAQTDKELEVCLLSQGNRVVLSGVGGDEVAGGVPTPTPELGNLIATARLRTLAHELKVWGLSKRKPWFYLLFETAREFLPSAIAGEPRNKRRAPWLRQEFARRYAAAMSGYESRLTLRGPLPSFQDGLRTLNGLRRQLACVPPSSLPPYEKSYPFLDRDLLEFLYAIPREQLVRPGERRSLMRRALRGIVPDELLDRRRKAFVSRAPRAAISEQFDNFANMAGQMICSGLEVIDAAKLLEALRSAPHDPEVSIVSLIRTLRMEAWLRALQPWAHRVVLSA
jgi:asparagine synthase (glutamine-hydrolysing)